MQHMAIHQQLNLPVPVDQIDQSTFNQNLPQGNDRVPQIQLSQLMQQNQQIAGMTIGQFRLIAQSTVQKTPLHVFAYNLLSQNQFQNQIYQQWCQMAVNFVEFLIIVKKYQPNEAIKVAGSRLYEAYLGQCFVTYQTLQQVVPQNLWQGLQTAQQVYQSISNDIANYQRGAFNNNNNMMMGNQNSFNTSQLPPISSTMNIGQAAPMGMASYPSNNLAPVANNFGGAQTSSDLGSGMYDDYSPTPAKSMQPVEEVSSDMYPLYANTEVPQMQMLPVEETTDLPVPMNVDEVVVDPSYYQKPGQPIDFMKPYDVIWNPGNVEIRPAHKTDWQRTKGDMEPYACLADPQTMCRFFVKFPDGVVCEKFVEWTPQMEYLRHELDDDLRRQNYRPKGVVYAVDTPISTIGGQPVDIGHETFEITEDMNMEQPIILPGMFTGSTELETEAAAREAIVAQLGKLDVLPAHEYVVARPYLLEGLRKEALEVIELLAQSNDLISVGTSLKELVQNGSLSIRYFRMINERLTDSMNSFLKDSLSMTVSLDSYADDIGDLMDYIATKKGDHYIKIIVDNIKSILGKSLTVEMIDENPAIMDLTVVYQCGYSLEQIASLNIYDEATLVSQATSPVLLEILKGIIARAVEQGRNVTHKLRLATADGVYLDIIAGKLVERAVLLKRVR